MVSLLSAMGITSIMRSAQILELFKVSGAGKVAGCKIIDGEIQLKTMLEILII